MDNGTDKSNMARRTPKRPTATALQVERLKKRLAAARRTIAALRLHADTDALLDILNRRGFERELRRSIAYIRRYDTTAALVFIDLDRLKPVNDTLGHAAGDAILKAVSKTLVANVRQSDMVARLGGDEFGVLLWNLGASDAAKKARALETAIDRIDVAYRGRSLTIGGSAGVIMLDGGEQTADALSRADQAMYQRKRARRNRKRR